MNPLNMKWRFEHGMILGAILSAQMSAIVVEYHEAGLSLGFQTMLAAFVFNTACGLAIAVTRDANGNRQQLKGNE